MERTETDARWDQARDRAIRLRSPRKSREKVPTVRIASDPIRDEADNQTSFTVTRRFDSATTRYEYVGEGRRNSAGTDSELVLQIGGNSPMR